MRRKKGYGPAGVVIKNLLEAELGTRAVASPPEDEVVQEDRPPGGRASSRADVRAVGRRSTVCNVVYPCTRSESPSPSDFAAPKADSCTCLRLPSHALSPPVFLVGKKSVDKETAAFLVPLGIAGRRAEDERIADVRGGSCLRPLPVDERAEDCTAFDRKHAKNGNSRLIYAARNVKVILRRNATHQRRFELRYTQSSRTGGCRTFGGIYQSSRTRSPCDDRLLAGEMRGSGRRTGHGSGHGM